METGIILKMSRSLYARFLSLDGAQKTLSQSDAIEIVEELLPAINESLFLAGKLKLLDHTVKALARQYTDPKECLYHIIVEFLKGVEPRPTWRVILDALRSSIVNLPRLAKEIERRHGFHMPTSRMWNTNSWCALHNNVCGNVMCSNTR